jgi:glycogen(starch) synthase
MRVAIFASAFYPSLGGVEELVRQLALAYRRAGVPTIVVTEQWPRSLPAFEEYEGVPVYRFPFRVPDGGWKVRLSYLLRHERTCRQMLRVLRNHSVDLLHVQCVSSNGYYALQAARALKLPLVVTAQGELTMDASHVYDRSPFLRTVLGELLTDAVHVTACSGNALADVERFYGRPFGGRASVVYNGIRIEDFAGAEPYASARPYVFGIGRLVKQKGFDILLRAFAAANVPSHDLLIAGDGEERAALAQLAADLGLGDRARFFGRADRKQAVALFRGASFFVLPSRREPFGIVNLEAMAAGKAVIATQVGGVPEIVRDGETGLLVPGDDVNGLAAAISRLAADAGLRERLADTARRFVGPFDWSEIARSYLSVYDMARGSTPGVLPREEIGAHS